MSALLVGWTGVSLVQSDVTASEAGFILSFALMISGSLCDFLQRATSLEQIFVSAERINTCESLRYQG